MGLPWVSWAPQGYVSQRLPAEELRAKLELCRDWARRSSAENDLEAYALLLEASLQLGDLQARATLCCAVLCCAVFRPGWLVPSAVRCWPGWAGWLWGCVELGARDHVGE